MALKFKKEEIPDAILACVWFADPDQLDWEKQQELVIAAVLNRGQWEAVRWVHRVYGEAAMKAVVSHPQRGQWFPQALCFWLTFFHLSLDRGLFERALLKFS